MAAHLIEPTDPIDVKHVGVVLYGQPGARKTSLAMTAAGKTFTFAFDPGVHRMYAPVRKSCALFDDWADVVLAWNNAAALLDGHAVSYPEGLGRGDWPRYELMLKRVVEADAVVLDTAGAGMEKMADAMIRENAKNGNRLGGLSLQGYGVLGVRFSSWVAQLYERGKDLVMVAHEDAEKNGDEDYHFPSFVGRKFYNTAMRYADLVGYLHFANGKRVIGWEPTDRYMAKTPPCGWRVMPLPELKDQPDFLERLLAEAKASMGRISADSAAVAAAVAKFAKWLEGVANAEQLNGGLPDLTPLVEAAKRQAWHLMKQKADDFGLVFDKAKKEFVAKEGVAA